MALWLSQHNALAHATEMVSEDFLVWARHYGDAHQEVLYVSVHTRSCKCAPHFKINKHYSDYLSFIAHTNLTRLGRDKLIYGLIIIHSWTLYCYLSV